MKIHVSSIFPCEADRVWQLVEKSSTLTYVASPLARIVPSRGPFPRQWVQNEKTYCKSYLFGFLPVGERMIFFERIDSNKRELQSREQDFLIHKWDHLISVKPIDVKTSLYSDEVEISAGALTFIVALWAKWFYRHRQKRWQNLLADGFKPNR